MRDTTPKLDEIRMEDGKLPSAAFPGGYQILYLQPADGGEILCPACANDCDADEQSDMAWSIFYEGPPEICAECNAEVESAYGDPDEA